jgi:hypothetical protein
VPVVTVLPEPFVLEVQPATSSRVATGATSHLTAGLLSARYGRRRGWSRSCDRCR